MGMIAQKDAPISKRIRQLTGELCALARDWARAQGIQNEVEANRREEGMRRLQREIEEAERKRARNMEINS